MPRNSPKFKKYFLIVTASCKAAGSDLGYCMNTGGAKADKVRVQTDRIVVGEPVWVQCEGFRCLAYLNERGEWRAFSNNAKLTDVVKVLDVPPANRLRR